jgi:hypothetical protein
MIPIHFFCPSLLSQSTLLSVKPLW